MKPLNLEKILLLDSNTFKSLQIFNTIDFSCAYRQTNLITSNTFRTGLASKKLNNNNITLYGLFLSKMQTKIGISKLRSFLMKPTRDINILNERHRVIDSFCSNRNQELTSDLRQSLKKCKFISSILKRMKLTRIKWNEWKRLYKTTKSLLDIYNLCLQYDELLNGSNSNKMSRTTSDVVSFIGAKMNKNSTFISGVNQEFEIQSNILTPKTRTFTQSENSIIKSSIFENISTDNLFSRIQASNYGPKFEYLITLFENSVNIEESNQKQSSTILPNISSKIILLFKNN